MNKKLELYKDYASLRSSIGAVQKSGKNPHFKNTFVELNTALQVIDENLGTNNFITFVQLPFHKEGKNFLKTKLIHKNGEEIEGDLELITVRQDPQMLGSSLTYARRYSLITMLGLQAVDDDGNEGSGHSQKDKLKGVVDELNQEAYKQIEARKKAISKYSILLEFKNPKNKDDMLKTFKTKNIEEMRKLYKELQEA